jgi:hypothetical protein
VVSRIAISGSPAAWGQLLFLDCHKDLVYLVVHGGFTQGPGKNKQGHDSKATLKRAGPVASAQLQSIYATRECGPKVINLKEIIMHGKESSPQIAASHVFEPRELGPSSQQFWALGFFTRVQAQTN